jgi:hypothetical protein
VLVIVALDALLSGNTVLIGFLGVAPILSALRGQPRGTIVVAVAAVAAGIALGAVNSMFGSIDHVIRVTVLTLISGLAVWFAFNRQSLERARFRSSLIAEVGSVMSGALDFEVSLIELARLCSRRLSDWCFIFIREEDGTIRQLAAAHESLERQSLGWELLYRYPLDPNRSEGPAKVIRTGISDLQPVIHEDVLRAISADEENLEMLRALKLRSAMITPLLARGRILGAIAFASAESGRTFNRDDLAMAEEVASRAAMSLDNARLYMRLSQAEQEQRTAH